MYKGGNDCRAFAVAYETALCLGKSPSKYLFNQKLNRKHLQVCLEHENVTMFPIIKERRRGEIINIQRNIQVFCNCKMPENQWFNVPTCRDWLYIGACVSVTESQMKDKTLIGVVIDVLSLRLILYIYVRIFM